MRVLHTGYHQLGSTKYIHHYCKLRSLCERKWIRAALSAWKDNAKLETDVYTQKTNHLCWNGLVFFVGYLFCYSI